MTTGNEYSQTGKKRRSTAIAAAAAALFFVVGASHTPGQTAALPSAKPSGPKFDVASIRPSRSLQEMAETGKWHTGITLDAARVDIGYWSILQLIVRAYRLQPFQLIGPDWMGLHRFDVQANLPQGSTRKQLPEMLQWLLADRFGLKAHFDTKELNGFALEVGKGGVKMDAAPPDPAANTELAAKEEEADTFDLLSGSGTDKEPFGRSSISASENGEMHMEFEKLPIPVLAQLLSSYLGAPVEDQTGLRGRFKVRLDFSKALTATASPGQEDFAADNLFTAVKLLGLKLERRPVRCNVLVVDHVERTPTAN